MGGNVYLGGGGSAEQEAMLWAEAFRTGDSVVIWPFAHGTAGGREASIAWMRQALEPYKLGAVEAWTDSDVKGRSLSDVDVVSVPGGNTFRLLNELRSAGLLQLLHDHLRDGGRLYGGSAGAILAGADIGIARDADPNDVGLMDTSGLDLLDGIDVLPHYTADQRETARSHAVRTTRPVLCLPEASGAVIREGRIRNAGPELIEIVDREKVRVLVAGEEFPASPGN
ncbi:MAG: Type 1 glutamine amidotransferase-like domain-containing protein [Actinomycetota bacterium]